MPEITIDKQVIDVEPGTTLMAAARHIGVQLPALCYREGLEHVTSCMVCVVEDCSNHSLRPACSTIAEKGMLIATDSEKALEARRMALDLLLSDHLGDCQSPCRRACPAAINISAMLRAIAGSRMEKAVRIIRQTLALPAVLGRICSAPCEKGCKRRWHDDAVNICELHRYVADLDLAGSKPFRPELAEASGFHVAVAGAGPAGLAATYYLRQKGHRCTLFEKEEKLGGGLRADELQEKLPAAVLEAEVEGILKLGVDVKTNIEIGRQMPLAQLKKEFDGVVLTIGELSSDTVRKLGLSRSRRGVTIDKDTCQTSESLVFAAGSTVLPSRLAVRSAAHGHYLAAAVDQVLRGQSGTGRRRSYQHHFSRKLNADELTELLKNGVETCSRLEIQNREAGKYTQAEARQEAARCLQCDCRKRDNCKLRQYAADYNASQRRWQGTEMRYVRITRAGNLIYEPGKCIVCGICIRITATDRESLGLAFVGRGFDVRLSVPFNESLEKGLGKLADQCVAYCPTGALAYAEKNH